MLANPVTFDITGETAEERETQAWDAACTVKKSEFALNYAINETGWTIPRYIEEGLSWLANTGTTEAEAGPDEGHAVEVVDA